MFDGQKIDNYHFVGYIFYGYVPIIRITKNSNENLQSQGLKSLKSDC